MKRPILNKLIYLIVLCSFISCKSVYDINKNYYSSNEEKFANSKNLKLNFPLSISFNGNIETDNKKHKITGSLICRDSNNFQLKIYSKSLGIEISRAQFYGDSVLIINKLGNNYFKGKIEDFQLLINSGFETKYILEYLFGRSFSSNNLLWETKDNSIYNYSNSDIHGSIKLEKFGFNSYNYLNINDLNLKFNYDNYYIKYAIPFSIKGTLNNDKFNFNIDLVITGVNKFDAEFKNFDVPDNFQRIK